MRQTIEIAACRGLLAAAILLGACDSVPMNDGHFWKTPDAAPISPDADRGAGGAAIDPGMGSRGSGGGAGAAASGGPAGRDASGGTAGTGGRPASGGASSGGRDGGGGSGGLAPSTGGSRGSGGALGSGGAGSGTGGAGTGTGGGVASAPGMLAVSVTTRSAGGRYEPDNVGAIWITDGTAKFVKTLNVWGSQRRKELRVWIAATTAAGVPSSVVDAVTSATKSGHGVRTGTWNGTNVARALVPDGPYKVCFELEDGNRQTECVDVVKSRSAQTVTPPDTTSFTKRSLVYTP